jgi:hypothetical protein
LEKKPKQMGKRQSEALSFFVFLHLGPLRSSQRSFFRSFPLSFAEERNRKILKKKKPSKAASQ